MLKAVLVTVVSAAGSITAFFGGYEVLDRYNLRPAWKTEVISIQAQVQRHDSRWLKRDLDIAIRNLETARLRQQGIVDPRILKLLQDQEHFWEDQVRKIQAELKKLGW